MKLDGVGVQPAINSEKWTFISVKVKFHFILLKLPFHVGPWSISSNYLDLD